VQLPPHWLPLHRYGLQGDGVASAHAPEPSQNRAGDSVDPAQLAATHWTELAAFA
jgi:hypothetical protein